MQNCNKNEQNCNNNANFATKDANVSMFASNIQYRRGIKDFNNKHKFKINPFYKVMRDNKYMIEGISGLGRDIYDDFAIETTSKSFNVPNRFIVSLNPESYRRFAFKYTVSTETIKRTYRELIDRGLLIYAENGTKYDYIFNFMPVYSGSDEEYAKDVDDYNIKQLYEPYYHKLVAHLDEKRKRYQQKK